MCLLIYLDDIIIFLATFKEHLKSVEQVLEQLEEHVLKPHKYHLFKESKEYLGHTVSGEEVQPMDSKNQAVQKKPTLR